MTVEGDGEPPPKTIRILKPDEPQERIDGFNEDNDDDLLISQAYDQFITQDADKTHQRLELQFEKTDLGVPSQTKENACTKMVEVHPEKINDSSTHENFLEKNDVDSLEDLITLGDLIGPGRIEDGGCQKMDDIFSDKRNDSRRTHENSIENNDINFLEDPVTLEDLIGPVISTVNDNFGQSDVDMNDLENDISESSVIANIILMDIFEQCWGDIVNKKLQQNESSMLANVLLTEAFDRAWRIIKPKSRWRIPNPNTWIRNVAKKRRADGLPYVSAKKIRDAKLPKPIDCTKCKFNCTKKFSEDDRERFCRKYWSKTYVGKKNFILNLIEIKPIKTTAVVRKRPTQRKNSKQYYFKNVGVKEQVCQNFFCKTLCISASVVTDAVEKQDEMGCYSQKVDPRGRHEPLNKTTPEQLEKIQEHINSFPKMESHYVRKDTKRQYLDCKLSIIKMYNLYKEECQKTGDKPVSEATYRKIFCTDFNLGFFVPKKDQCLLCTKYDRSDAEGKVKLDLEYKEHIKRKETCNKEKQKDKERAEKENDFISASFDLQAILQIPSGDVGPLYYCRKLTVYNLTIYESAFPNEAFCFAWTEVNGKKGSPEIGSIILHYLAQIPDHVKEVSLFSDTCGGQNRNQYVAAVLLWAVHKIDHINVIEHKFLESGHTYMEVDSMHSSIEHAQKHTSVFSVTDWLNIFKRARSSKQRKGAKQNKTKKPYHVKEMKYNEFKDLKALAKSLMINKAKTNEGQRVKWLKIKRMRYVKGETKVFYNYDMSNNFYTLDLGAQDSIDHTPEQDNNTSLQKHCYGTRQSSKQVKKMDTSPAAPTATVHPFFPHQLEPLYTDHLPIPMAKKADLLKLCKRGVIPEEYHGWFQNLKADGEKVDRVPDLTVSDDSEYDADD